MFVYLIAPTDTYWAGRNSAFHDLARFQARLARDGQFATSAALAAAHSGVEDSNFTLLKKADRVLVVPLEGWESSPLVASEIAATRKFGVALEILDESETRKLILGIAEAFPSRGPEQ